ncbi:MAG TPA: ATP-binding protein [Verrucomicrobiae bacterium]|nr:ATP-binding protein [Verrucomicrobiae bacterium]
MTIRARLTFWYAGIMFVSLLAMGWLSYREFAPEPRSAPSSLKELKDAEEDEGELHDVFRILLWCGVPAALLALGGGWWLTRKSLAPVTALTRAAEKITERNLRERLPHTGNGDELDGLTEVFNAMTVRLDGSFQRIREFTLHASHELKTPLTVMHGELETALREENLFPAPRERLLSQLDEVQRLSKIVDGLTLLTKADAGQIQLAHEPVRLDDVVRDAFADAQILAEPRSLKVELLACEELTVKGDRHRLRQLLLNLADNAIKYNQPGGRVTMSLRRAEDSAELAIANTGPGIPPEILPRVFDRFFRGDAAHGNGVDGCGLGLSIAQWIASAHSGSIRIASELANYTIVTVRLPLAAEGVKAV